MRASLARLAAFLLLLPALARLAAGAPPEGSKKSLAGSVVMSEEWDVRRDKGEEEFRGHVRFDQGNQHARAAWAQYAKPLDLWQAHGDLYMWDIEADGSRWEAWGERGQYHPLLHRGILTAPGSVVRFRRTFTASKGLQLWLGNAGLARWDGVEQTLYLEQGTALDGDGLKVRAQKGLYQKIDHRADFSGGRPLALLSDAKTTAAVQADVLTVFDQQKHVTATGNVRGWIHLKHNPKADDKGSQKGKKKKRRK